ncbi:hypothetical protein B0T19DRAFT_399076 [Cercophora scortea]|uniref:Uncharacterized protein n=1 Tax=Cercophora scortea TaxID=314031 RepID=A0AAE0IYG7_9PEZI|nr:hypothetical protein B0T19DRAFT_399076 [Cercophora scortea]
MAWPGLVWSGLVWSGLVFEHLNFEATMLGSANQGASLGPSSTTQPSIASRKVPMDQSQTLEAPNFLLDKMNRTDTNVLFTSIRDNGSADGEVKLNKPAWMPPVVLRGNLHGALDDMLVMVEEAVTTAVELVDRGLGRNKQPSTAPGPSSDHEASCFPGNNLGLSRSVMRQCETRETV